MTTNGYVVVAAAGGAAVLWLVVGHPGAGVFVLCCLFALAPGLVQRVRRPGPFTVTVRVEPASSQRDDSATVTVTAEGTDDSTPAGTPIQVDLVVVGQRVSCHVNPSAPTSTVSVTATSRGQFAVKITGVTTRDLLGLWRISSRHKLRAPITTVVRPRSLRCGLPSGQGADEELPTAPRGAGSTAVGLRQYQPGDDLRRVDWAATARSADDVILVRQGVRPKTSSIMIILDPRPSRRFPGDDQWFEDRVDLAFSLVRLASGQGRSVRLALSYRHKITVYSGTAAAVAALIAARPPGTDPQRFLATCRKLRAHSRETTLVVTSDLKGTGPAAYPLRDTPFRGTKRSATLGEELIVR